MYTSLHNHTHYSNLRLLDALSREDQLIDKAYELGLKGVAITDHDSVSGHVKALNYYYDNYKDNDFKLILGNEIYLTRSDLTAKNHQKGEKFYHFLLLAKDEIGHRQLREISTKAWSRSYMKNMMRVPTFQEDLEEVVGENPGHLIATTACLGGYTGSMFQSGQLEFIPNFLNKIQDIFGKENFFIEIQPSRQEDQIEYNKYMLINYWDDYDFIFTTDSHYLQAEDREVHKWLLHSQSGDREVDAFYSSTYLMDYEELKSYFDDYISMPKIEAMKDNTNKINDMIEMYELSHDQIVPKVEYEFEKINNEAIEKIIKLFEENDLESYWYLNKFITNPENDTDKYFIQLVLQGYHDKIYELDSDDEILNAITTEERMKRLNYELEQVYETSIKINQSLSDYFITMGKIIEIIWNEAQSLVGPGRGSASGFLVNYLTGITQLDPQAQELHLPPWRFIHQDRPELPDIDIDTESNKRLKIFNKIREYFNEIGSDVVNVCTFGKEKSKSAIRTAARGLQIEDSVASYLTSMIPNERGFDWTLSQCYEGDEGKKPIRDFREEMDKYPKLKKFAFAIEGLITRVGVHAAGIIILEGSPAANNSIMRTSSNVTISAFNLEDSEQMGGLKYDMLTIAALDKIHAAMNYMLEDGELKWKGTLRDTYEYYLLPAVLEKKDPKMWYDLGQGNVPDVFQFDTVVGSQAVRDIKPQSITELAVANSIMRLMAQDDMDAPIETYVAYKNDIDKWYREMKLYGLEQPDIEILEPHLKPLYGVADSQESVMQLVMDEKITDFTINEANSLRKAIAKKKKDVLEKTKEMYYQKGQELGTNKFLLDYIWNIQIGRQIGYSFSILHTMAYSYIALQEMNLSFLHPSIYWKTACLSVNAGAINEEDYFNLVEQGIIELSDEDDIRASKKIEYGKVASAIGDMRGSIEVKQPDINKSRLGFTPNVKENTILYGIKGIARIGDKIIHEIILNRPYESLEDFINKMVTPDGKKIISKDKVVNLIKAGAFDELENMPREDILKKYIDMISDQKQKLNLNNFLMMIRKNLVPEHLDEEVAMYNFTRYIRKSKVKKDGKEYYEIDNIAEDYLSERNLTKRIKQITVQNESKNVVERSWWDSIYENYMNTVRKWIKDNHEILLEKLNEELFNEEYEKYAEGDILDWELESLNFFYSGHPLDGVNIPLVLTRLENIEEDKIIGFFEIKGKKIPKRQLYTIAGTVIDKNKQKSMITLATKDGVIDVKFYKQLFAKYAHETNMSDEDLTEQGNQEDFLKKGTHLAITGIKRGDVFVPKVYKSTKIPEILKLEIDGKEFKGFKNKA
ncbi:MAG: PHP domain-containing protein [archaeon]